jgi:hypothetical protein
VIIAAALLLAEVPSLQAHPRAYQIGATLIAAHFVLSQSEPVKHTFQSSKPSEFCVEHFPYTRRIRTFSFCGNSTAYRGLPTWIALAGRDVAARSSRSTRELPS